MAYETKISWTDSTWNPITGCSRVSKGCEHCYAERLAAGRLRHHPSRAGLTDDHGRWNGTVRFNEEWIEQPLQWKKPRRIFVVAHGDLFHENVPFKWVDRVFAVMAAAPQHTFQVLTKRPARARVYLHARTKPLAVMEADLRRFGRSWKDIPTRQFPLPNVWIGTSVEDQKTFDERYPHLRETPAAVRWLSIEPLLGRILFDHLPKLDWVVVGGESGPGYRPMEPDWARDISAQCALADVPFFMKQMAGKSRIPADLLIRQYPR